MRRRGECGWYGDNDRTRQEGGGEGYETNKCKTRNTHTLILTKIGLSEEGEKEDRYE